MMDLRLSGCPQPTIWRMPVAAWAVWGGDGVDDGFRQNLDFIDPMLRRRLSPLAKAALHVAQTCAAGKDALQFVYASRHGELSRTVEALRNLAHHEPLSPTTFSLSVLNSAAGIFSIARKDTSPTTAVSAGLETFGFGLLEAYARASMGSGGPVLFVYGDAPAPAPLGRQECDPPAPLAVAILIDSASATYELEMTMHCGPHECSTAPQARACVAALHGRKENWSSATRRWQWELHAK